MSLKDKNMSCEIKPEYYVPIYQEIAKVIGIESTRIIFQEFKGIQVNFPNHLYNNRFIYDYLKANYNGKNMREMARLFDYSERRLRQILKKYDEVV